ncbi:MAG: GDP-mannose 4,6-dehydratase [Kiritimatiellales bacterium]|nr:GDP-mannose 4,6-dehydratase [Kiritimatiellota bacterium]MBL7011635.1 GDP-mannose 4,6-dehydratase [Kiritimatiellales bacterium]
MKKALITGVNGQDGSYLSELLLEKGYEVHGMVRRSSALNRQRIDALRTPAGQEGAFHLHYGDMGDDRNLLRLMEKVVPDEVYNLASQSHVQISFEMPQYSFDVNAAGTLRLLSAIHEVCSAARFYQASSSELFGRAAESPQTEQTPFHPCSPYAVSKLSAFWTTVNYRETYGLHASNGILFNHESPRRGENFVTRKITRAVACIVSGADEVLSIGNLEARRDWGYAPDYVDAMWRILQQDAPDDYVIATGQAHSVREFIDAAFKSVGIRVEWNGEKDQACGVNAETGRKLVQVDPSYYRPLEPGLLVGDASRARDVLGWEPRVGFDELVGIMVQADLVAYGAGQ